MGPTTRELVERLRQLQASLERLGEAHWAGWIARDIDLLELSDFYGIEHFLSAFGGMGSLNDLVIHPLNGHTCSEAEVESVNARLRAELSDAHALAAEIKRISES